MAIIFSASSDSGSFERSSRLIGPVVHWLFPHLPDPDVHNIVVGIRKMAHLTEFAILALLLQRALAHPFGQVRRSDGSATAWALVFTVLYAASDEFHQVFVPSRQASVIDVMIDSLGGIAGLALLCGFKRLVVRANAQRGRIEPG